MTVKRLPANFEFKFVINSVHYPCNEGSGDAVVPLNCECVYSLNTLESLRNRKFISILEVVTGEQQYSLLIVHSTSSKACDKIYQDCCIESQMSANDSLTHTLARSIIASGITRGMPTEPTDATVSK